MSTTDYRSPTPASDFGMDEAALAAVRAAVDMPIPLIGVSILDSFDINAEQARAHIVSALVDKCEELKAVAFAGPIDPTDESALLFSARFVESHLTSSMLAIGVAKRAAFEGAISPHVAPAIRFEGIWKGGITTDFGRHESAAIFLNGGMRRAAITLHRDDIASVPEHFPFAQPAGRVVHLIPAHITTAMLEHGVLEATDMSELFDGVDADAQRKHEPHPDVRDALSRYQGPEADFWRRMLHGSAWEC